MAEVPVSPVRRPVPRGSCQRPQAVGAVRERLPRPNYRAHSVQDEGPAQGSLSEHNGRPSSGRNEADAEDMDVLLAEAAARLTITHEDVVVAVMGLTGTGKSTFIELLSKAGVEVSSGLQSCTVKVGVFPFRYRDGRTIYLVDTPGFDDTNMSDTQVLKRLAAFLGTTHARTIKLAGIIYLHRITDNKMGGQALRNLTMFQKLCGKKDLSRVVLATTMWDKLLDPVEGEGREQELIDHDDWWGLLRELGSEVRRHNGTFDSALCILDYLMTLEGNGIVTALAEDIVDKKLPLEATAVGQVFRQEILEAEARHAEEIQQVKKTTEAMIAAGKLEAAAKLTEMTKKMEKEQQQREEDIKDLKKKHSDLEEENRTKHNETVTNLRNEIQGLQSQANADKEKFDTVNKTLKNIQDSHDTVQKELAKNKLQHQRDLDEMDGRWKREREQWEADKKEDQRQRDEARRGRDDRDFLSVAGSYTAGTLLGLFGAVALNPGAMALSASCFAGGAATAANSLRRSR